MLLAIPFLTMAKKKKTLPYLQVHKIRKPLYYYTTLQWTIAKSGYLIR